MAQVDKIDSNITEARYAEEASQGVLPGTPNWIPLEPNSYTDFGGTVTTIARNPINPSRQRKKGVITDLDATAGLETDITQTNIQDLLQGFMFADFRAKGEEAPTTTATGANELYNVAETAGFYVGSLIMGSGFDDAENNGLKNVITVTADTSVEVTETLVADASPATGAKIVAVGFLFTAGDLDVDASGTLPRITTTTKDLTELGLTVGEWVYIGGDSAALAFVNAENNGFKRVRSIATNAIEFDKSTSAMVTEASTTETIQLFIPRALKNETGASIVRRTYQFERSLGAPDDASPAQIQGEYVVGAVASQLTMNIATASKLITTIDYIGTDHETVTGVTGLKSGNRPALVESDAFNTSSDFSRIKLSEVVAGDEAPTPLFAFVTDATITIDNSVKANKAVGVLGSCGMTAGTFVVSGSMTAYFSNVAAIQAVRENKDVTFDFAIVKDNAGMVVDIPLLALGDGKANITQDEPITIPLTADAATAAKIDANLDHTLMFCFFDYLPTAAG